MSKELNCSDGAKLLIEQMRADPEKFAKYRPWQDLIDHAINTAEGKNYSKVMSRRDAQALYAAYETHILEPKLAERVLNELMEPKEKEKTAKQLLTQQEVNEYANRLLESEYIRASRQEEARRIAAAQQQERFGGAIGNAMGGRWR